MQLTRRHALAAAAGIAAAPLLSPTFAGAAAPVADKQAPSFYRYKVGDIQVTVVSDGRFSFPLEDTLIPNARKEEVDAALEQAFLPRDMFTIYFAPLVINTGGKLVVVDTGNGPVAKANSKGANGQFADNMAAAGFDPKAVDMVVISHFHGDHVNGLLAVSERRSAGARDRMEILDGRRRDEPRPGRTHAGPVQEQSQHLRCGPQEESHAL